MRTVPTINDLKNYKTAGQFYLPIKQLLFWCALVLSVMLVVGTIVAHILSSERYDLVTKNIHDRLEIRAFAKTNLIQSWLQGMDDVSKNITESDTLRLFVSEAVFDKKTQQEKRSLKAQRPYLIKTLKEYSKWYNSAHAAVVTRKGNILLSAHEGLVLSREHKHLIAQSVGKGKVIVAPLSLDDGRMLMLHIKPIFSIDEEDQKRSMAAFISFFSVFDALTHHLNDGPLALAGERTRFIQKRSGIMEYLEMQASPATLIGIKPQQIERIQVAKRRYPENLSYVSPIDQKEMFGASHPVLNTPFILLQEYDKDAALAYYYNYRNAVYLSMLLVVMFVAAALSTLLVYVMSARNRVRVTHQQQMLNALVRAVEIRDPYLSGHHERMARMALKVGNAMRLTVPERSTLYYSAMLSSVGKIFIPQKILSKPGELTTKEKHVLHEHIDHAEKVLSDISFDLPVSEVISRMYERIDGSGYPLGMKGADIPLLSRILAVCDVYCALTRPRSYRDALSVEDALSVLEKEIGRLDKGVVSLLNAIVHGEDLRL